MAIVQAGSMGVALIEEPQLIYLPLWRETLTWVEYFGLRASPVYRGAGVPHGDESPVVVVPGFLAHDAYLFEMRLWLRRIGYRPFKSQIGINAECPDILVKRLMKTVSRAYGRKGRKVHLIGHSLGGILARIVASQAPEKVASVITLASPFRGVRVNPFIGQALKLVRRYVSVRRECPHEDCFSRACECTISASLNGNFPHDIPQTALYTKQDGIVDWQTCINDDHETDVEVSSTHVGMAWNSHVYQIIAHRLAEAGRHQGERI